MRVLYVDDEPAVARAVRTWLIRHGHEVYVASSLADARAQLADHPVDGAIIDLKLRDESGLDLQAWLAREHPELAEHTAFVSGDADPSGVAGDLLRKLGKPVLAKPFAFTELERVIETWKED